AQRAIEANVKNPIGKRPWRRQSCCIWRGQSWTRFTPCWPMPRSVSWRGWQVCWGELWRSQTWGKNRERDVYEGALLGPVGRGRTSRLSPVALPMPNRIRALSDDHNVSFGSLADID